MLEIQLPKDIEDRLSLMANKTGRTKTYYAREAILNYLDDLEDTYYALEAINNMNRLLTLEEVEKELGLDV